MKYEILVADDHSIIRDGLRKIIGETHDLVVAGEASNGLEALELVRQRDWGAVILDISMPGRNGLETIKLMKAERAHLPILVFSMHSEEQYALRALHAGACGYLSKEGDSDLIVPALRRVADGSMFISQKVAEMLAAEASGGGSGARHKLLSNREFEIFDLIVHGHSSTNIAAKLSLSIKTVSTHKSNILAKLGLDNSYDLYRYAVDHRLLDPDRE